MPRSDWSSDEWWSKARNSGRGFSSYYSYTTWSASDYAAWNATHGTWAAGWYRDGWKSYSSRAAEAETSKAPEEAPESSPPPDREMPYGETMPPESAPEMPLGQEEQRPAAEAFTDPAECGKAFATWLLEIDSTGSLSAYRGAIEESYDTVDQIIRLYSRDEGVVDVSFFDDVGIEDPNHRHLFSAWFAAVKIGNQSSSPRAAACVERDESCRESMPSPSLHAQVPSTLAEAPLAPIRTRADSPSGRCWAPFSLLWGGLRQHGDTHRSRVRSEPPPKPSGIFGRTSAAA